MLTASVQQAFALGVQHHQAGRLGEAEAVYRQILAVQPNHAGALHLLGVIDYQAGRHDLAVDWISRALVVHPDNPAAHYNLGNAHKDLGQPGEAIAAYRRALQLQPNYPEAHNNLGIALAAQGHFDEAMTAYRRALQDRPKFAAAEFNLGNVLRDADRPEEAVAAHRRAIQLAPDYPEAHNNLGVMLAEEGRLDEAVTALRRAIELRPSYAEAHNNLGNALKDAGEAGEAIVAYGQAHRLQPADPAVLSNLIYAMHLSPSCGAAAIQDEQARWNRHFVAPRRPTWRPHTNDPTPGRRLKIGYVSPDFHFHAIAFFLTPLLEAHDREAFEIYCYASVERPDEFTQRQQKAAGVWRDVRRISDTQLAEQVRADGIDILVDLAMHTADNHLLAFAHRPAPVQVSWLAYPGSTGIETIDYRISDHWLEADPSQIEVSSPETRHSNFQFPIFNPQSPTEETPVGLPDSWCCYAPVAEFPEVGPLPALASGAVTFGALNQFGKTHEGLLRCWAALLALVPASRLLMVCPEGRAQARVRALFAAQGIAGDRLELAAPRPWAEYIQHFPRIDLALDTFPCNGMTTTCHALWMGVPVVTKTGASPVSRAGSSLLHTLGLPEFIARSDEEYLRIAAGWTSDLPRLAELRAALRLRMAASPLMDAPRFARHIEAAYRALWRNWCAEQQTSRP